jgi:hypothetical protein
MPVLLGMGMSTTGPPASSVTVSRRSARALPTTAIGQRSRAQARRSSSTRSGSTAST